MIIDPSYISLGDQGEVHLQAEEVSRFVSEQKAFAPLRHIQTGCDNKGCDGANNGCANGGCH